MLAVVGLDGGGGDEAEDGAGYGGLGVYLVGDGGGEDGDDDAGDVVFEDLGVCHGAAYVLRAVMRRYPHAAHQMMSAMTDLRGGRVCEGGRLMLFFVFCRWLCFSW